MALGSCNQMMPLPTGTSVPPSQTPLSQIKQTPLANPSSSYLPEPSPFAVQASVIPVPANPSRVGINGATPTRSLTRVSVQESSLAIMAYAYEGFLQPRQDLINHFKFNAFDFQAFSRALNSTPLTTKTLHTIILENEFLRLTFLPELGGRLFQITYKPTRQTLLYNNRVLKPTEWGPPAQSGWFAVGGMEWALPVNEHGYEWGVPWQYTITRETNGVTISLIDSQTDDRINARIDVTLPDQAAYIIIKPRIGNPTPNSARLQFWINAALTLGSARNISARTEFSLPTNSVFVHSTADRFVPAKNVPGANAVAPAPALSWPVISGQDMSEYSNWDDYLGVFVTTPTRPFVGVYNHDAELGLARVFPPDQVPGVKLFAFGPNYCCRTEFSDDGSDYFELWGGLPRTFFPEDDVTLGPGEYREWTEYWLPFAKTGGFSAASQDAVLSLKSEKQRVIVSVYSAILREGTLVLEDGERALMRWPITLAPATSFGTTIQTDAKNLKLRLLDSTGNLIVETHN
jgi:Domain of unknown function (DUF5107)